MWWSFRCHTENRRQIIDGHQSKLELIIKAKDKAFDQIHNLKIDLKPVREDLAHHDTTILKNRLTFATLCEHVDATRLDHIYILKKTEDHDLKLNTSGSLGSKPWALQSDTKKYPLLHSFEKNLIFQSYTIYCQLSIWKAIQLRTSNNFMVASTQVSWLYWHHIIVSHIMKIWHTILIMRTTLYLHTDIHNTKTGKVPLSSIVTLFYSISQNQLPFPKTRRHQYFFLHENSLSKCGFDLLLKIIIALSHQLGGDYKDLQAYIHSFVISDREPVDTH